MAAEGNVSGNGRLRITCFAIGYFNLVACGVDIWFHMLITAIVSNGFQCDVDENGLSGVNWTWLEPFLLFLNMGTHGFYALPIISRYSNHHADLLLQQQLRCYPGMLHVRLLDILTLLVNLVLMKYVVKFIKAVHKKDPKPMRQFFQVWLVKLILQIMYFAYEPTIQNTFSAETFWFMKLVDISISIAFLFIINSYINVLRGEATGDTELPPTYMEYLVSAMKPGPKEENKGVLADIAICDKNDKSAEIKH